MTPHAARRAPLTSGPLAVALATAAWIAVFANGPLWSALAALPETQSAHGAVFIGAFGVGVAALVLALLVPFAWRRTIKPVAALVLLSAALGAHFMGTYGVVLDPTMMVNVLQTNAHETRDLLSPRLALTVLLLAGLPIAVLSRVRLRDAGLARQALHNAGALLAAVAVVVGLCLALFADFSATVRNHRTVRYLINPLNAYWSIGVVASHAGARPAGPPQAIGLDATVLPGALGPRPPLLLLVVGETARADHFGLNGYARATTPELARLDVVSFRDVTSCGTNTAASLPCMFSDLGHAGYASRERDREGLLDLLQRAGLAVLWVENQSGCKGVCDRVPTVLASAPAGGDPALLAGLCEDGECLDEALLRGLDER
ncbi:MAG TPA: phosphoethanolamine transferase domain-containing protein, partial [Gemmatimonadales bacterium]|nr:phosphoethanolamine transferase domain-containing protein [Gemmatimonadales bacterium]